jgi:two-component system, chemotaxis family, sensor kinase CheA
MKMLDPAPGADASRETLSLAVDADLRLVGHGSDDAQLALRLHRLLAPAEAQRLLDAVRAGFAAAGPATTKLRAIGGVTQRAASLTRCYDALLVFREADGQRSLELQLQDVTERQRLAQALEDARDAHQLTLAVRHGDPRRLRLFVDGATATLRLVQATLRMPARTQDACRDKLARVVAEIQPLREDALLLGFTAIANAAGQVEERITSIESLPDISGDELLCLPVLLDTVFARIGTAAEVLAQRLQAPAAAAPAPDWTLVCETRLAALVTRVAAMSGREARLSIEGHGLLPEDYRSSLQNMLGHLLRNAVEHGIEPTEERLRIGKPATGRIDVRIADLGAEGTEILVEDDGRGFDVDRIGRIAVASGVVTEETLGQMEPRRVIGLIFRPGFTSAGIDGIAGRGLGMEFLRELVTRLDGQISVATKPRRYTRFRIVLPVPQSIAGANVVAMKRSA